MDGRCATCEWWMPHEDAAWEAQQRPWGATAGFCLKVGCRHLKPYEVGLEPPQRGWPYLSEQPDSRAIATCVDEGIGGELVTAPDFGCVQWEKREE